MLGHGTGLFPTVYARNHYSVAFEVAASLFSLSFPQDSHAPAHFEDNVSQLYCEYVSLETVQQGEVPSNFPHSQAQVLDTWRGPGGSSMISNKAVGSLTLHVVVVLNDLPPHKGFVLQYETSVLSLNIV